jgi:diguanylate cyclase (GGDEF)-like protein/PAS domain S-box-containing protein
MNQGHILLVDDSQMSLSLLADMLTAEGYCAVSADSGKSALEAVANNLPALILLGLALPDMKGLEVLRQIKEQARSRHIPVVLLCSPSEADKREEYFRAGAADFISRPVQRDELLLRTRIHLDLFHLRSSLEQQASELRQAYEQLKIDASAERQRADDALYASEARYKRIIERITDCHYTVRVENGHAIETRQSSNCVNVTGYTAEEFAADPYLWIQIIAPDDRERVKERIQKILDGKEVPPIEHRITRKNWQTCWVSDTAILLKDATGKLLSYDGMIQDITERKRAENALRGSVARYRAITETTTYAIITANLEGNIMGWNAGAQRIFGYTKTEVFGQPLTILMPESYHERHLGGIGRARAGGQVSGKLVELHGLTKTGAEFPLELSLSEWKTSDGRFFTGIIRDITERKAVEKKLQESEARYKRITEGLTDYQYTVRIENGRAVGTTQSSDCVSVTGYTAEEFSQNPYLWIQMVLPEDRDRVREHVRQVLMGKDVPSIEHHIIRKDGKIRWVSDTIILFKDESGKLLSYDGVIKDITERKKAEEHIRNMAFYDPLTQLPNRRMLNDRLKQVMAASKRTGLYGALMFIDLDSFKPLNDTHGHEIGDLLLIEVAYRLTNCIREMDTVARFGGDEFVAIFSEFDTDKTESIKQAGIIAEKVRAAIAEPYLLPKIQEDKTEVMIEHHCTASIGVALFINHEATLEEIIKWADAAMYQAKEGGRNRYCFYQSE